MFHYLKNLRAQATTPIDHPSEFERKVPDAVMRTKRTFSTWCEHAATKHCHYSMVEGVDPLQRVGTENPPLLIHGIVADFDAVSTNEDLAGVLERLESEHAPAWASSTYSKGARLLWRFEAPLTVPNLDVAKRFLKHAVSELKINGLLAGLDLPATVDPCKYFEVGTNWGIVDKDAVIPSSAINLWAFESGDKAKWDHLGDVVIPQKDLALEIESRWPGVWKGTFEEGERGPRFWDEMASNPTAAVIRPTGMQCFSGSEGFMPWASVLGHKFVNKFVEERIGEVLTDSYFDGKVYWKKDSRGAYQCANKEDFKTRLRVRNNISQKVLQGRTASEMDTLLDKIHDDHRVTVALPVIHTPEGLYHDSKGELCLNTSRIKCMKPAERGDKPLEWGEGFPWMAEFLGGLFDPHEQLDFFLAWWQRFYVPALAEKPESGHALFIAGDTGLGKTLLSTLFVSKSVGGHSDASSYLMGDEKFTAGIVKAPIMAVDDTCPASDYRRHVQYSAMIKKIAANKEVAYEQKYQQSGSVDWKGRVIVTCNLDPESIRLLPNLDMNMKDKVSLFKCAERGKRTDFPNDTTLKAIAERELPFMLRWLVDWKAPRHCMGSVRFGAIPYHHVDLTTEAVQASSGHAFLEILGAFFEELQNDPDNKDTEWVGNAVKLYGDITLHEGLRPLINKYTARAITVNLNQLVSQGVPVTRVTKKSSRNQIWTIPMNIMEIMENEDDGRD